MISAQNLRALLLVLLFAATSISSRADGGVVQYILLNRAPGAGMNQSLPDTFNLATFQDVLNVFSNNPSARVQTGITFVFSPFRTKSEITVESLKNFLRIAAETATPIVVQLDFENWWEARPDLWNWWKTNAPGFNPENRNNVEWTGWSANDAIKIAWRDWGRQLRVLPPPNFSSPKYIAACREQTRLLVPIVMDWYKKLPESKKYIFVGLKVGHESSIGLNAYYYPNGNALIDQPAAQDPKGHLQGDDVTARGMVQLGYAAVKTAGLRKGGHITEADLEKVVSRHIELLCSEAADGGVPREKLFTHGVGVADGEKLYDAAVNKYSCPGWSFYRHAADTGADTGVRRNLKQSDAPFWAAVEWFPQVPMTTVAWHSALTNTLADPRCRYLAIFNWESIRNRDEIKKAIQQALSGSN